MTASVEPGTASIFPTLTTTVAALAALGLLVGCGSSPADDEPTIDAARPDAAIAIDAGIDAPFPMVDPAIDGRLVINEVMTANALTVNDDTGAASDWIELYNPTDTALDLYGYALTDDLATPRKSTLAPGTTIAAHGRLVLWADGEPAHGARHLRFSLDSDGGDLALARPDGTFIDRLTYGKQETDFSAAREPDGSDRWAIQWHPTPAAANAAGTGQPMGLDDPTAPPEAVPAAGDLTDQLLGYDEVPELAITVAPADVARLDVDPRTYVPATISFRGRAYGPVGLRLKGANSFEPFGQKPSLRIHVNEYVDAARLFGLKNLTLNNMHSDFSMMHERLAYWIARGVGLPASRCNHALLTVNGAFYGLYANVETIKSSMMKRWFDGGDAPLFEATDVDFAPAYVPLFDLDDGPDDRTMLTGVANAMTIADPDAALAAAAPYVDLDQFRRFWAFESLVAQLDAMPYSIPGDDYYVYADPTHKLSFIPSGIDESFYSAELDVTNVAGVLAVKCKASPTCFQAYANEVWRLQGITESMDLAGERVRIINRIAPYVAMDQRKSYPDSEVTNYQGQLYWFITERRFRLSSMIPPASP